MTGSQKAIKIISIIVIVVAVISIVIGLVTCVGSAAVIGAGSQASTADQETYALGAGLLLALAGGAVISGIIDLIVGILGLRGAKNPDKIMPFFVIAIIGAVFAVINVIGTLMSGQIDGTTLVSNIVQVALMVACVVLANNVRKLRA